MVEELGKLNERFYKLFGEFFENTQTMPNEPKGVILKHLVEQYKAEYERLRLQCEIKELNELHEISARHSELVPRKRLLFFANRSMKQLDNEVGSVIDRYFKIREKAFAELEKMIEECDAEENAEQRTTTFDEVEEKKLTAQMTVEELSKEDEGIISLNSKKKLRQPNGKN